MAAAPCDSDAATARGTGRINSTARAIRGAGSPTSPGTSVAPRNAGPAATADPYSTVGDATEPNPDLVSLARQGAIALLDAHLAVGVVVDLRRTHGVEARPLLLGQLYADSTQIVVQLLDTPSAQDHRCHRWPVDKPGEGHLGHRRAAVLGHVANGVDDV